MCGNDRSIATPDKIQFADDLPKTRWAKSCAGFLTRSLPGRGQLRDTSTLTDTSVIENLISQATVGGDQQPVGEAYQWFPVGFLSFIHEEHEIEIIIRAVGAREARKKAPRSWFPFLTHWPQILAFLTFSRYSCPLVVWLVLRGVFVDKLFINSNAKSSRLSLQQLPVFVDHLLDLVEIAFGQMLEAALKWKYSFTR